MASAECPKNVSRLAAGDGLGDESDAKQVDAAASLNHKYAAGIG